MLISNNCEWFPLWWRENLVKHQAVSEYYENVCLQHFLMPFISLLIAQCVKKGHIQARLNLIFLKILLKQTSNSFNTKFGTQYKNAKSSYQVRGNLNHFFGTNCSSFMLKQCKRHYFYQNGQKITVWRSLCELIIKKIFLKTISYEIFDTNSSF